MGNVTFQTRSKAKGWYVIINPVNPALLARAVNRIRPVGKDPTTADADILHRRWLPIDFDAVRPKGISASDEEHNAALELALKVRDTLTAAGWPEPIYADSGNGAHLLYRVDLPADDGGFIERCLKALATRFDTESVTVDTSVHNPARIWKLYGTLSCKGDNTPDRPHRMAHLLAVPTNIETVPEHLLESLADSAPGAVPQSEPPNYNGQFNLDKWIAEHGLNLRGPEPWQGGRRWVFETCPWDATHTNKSAFIVQGQDGKIGAGCHHNGCSGKDWHALRDIAEPGWCDKRKNRKPQGAATAEDESPFEFRRISCAELDATDYQLEYLIDGTLVAEQPCILAGGKKCLKTSLLIDLGISLAVGGHFLGKLKVNRACRVGIMSGESGLATIQETARRIAAAAGYRLGDISNLVFSDELPRFDSMIHRDALRRFCEDDELEAVAFDPTYFCLPDIDHANLFQVGEQLRGVAQVCQECGVMMILSHHTRKTKIDPFSPPELEDISWAGFQEFARQWLLVGRRELYQPGSGEHRLWLSAGGSAGHSALWAVDVNEGTRATPGGRFWDVNLLPANEARQQVEIHKEADKQSARQERLEHDKQTVCNAMAKYPTGETKTVIRDGSGLHSSRFNPAFGELLAEAIVVPCTIIKGNRKTPIDAYKLKESNTP